eukprot:645989-Amphidinium_carterae.2
MQCESGTREPEDVHVSLVRPLPTDVCCTISLLLVPETVGESNNLIALCLCRQERKCHMQRQTVTAVHWGACGYFQKNCVGVTERSSCIVDTVWYPLHSACALGLAKWDLAGFSSGLCS